MVETFGTASVSEKLILDAVHEVFDLRPGAIIDVLDLRRLYFKKQLATVILGGTS